MSAAKQLIRMAEGKGLLVEVEIDPAKPVQAASLGEIVDVRRSFAAVSDLLREVIQPFANTWQELSRDIEMSEATVKVSVGITAGGNFFLAKGEGTANLEVELKFKPLPESPNASVKRVDR